MKTRTTCLLLIVLLAAGVLLATDDERRKLLTVEFKEINAKGYPMLTMTNRTGKDVDDFKGAFVTEDLEGNVLHRTGQTEAIPGQLFLAAGASREMSPFGLIRREAVMEQLRAKPQSVRFYFETNELTYMDGSKEPLAR